MLTVSLLVTGFILWIVLLPGDAIQVSFVVIILFDLVLETLIAMTSIFLGQAVVAYEVFTGKTLPRRGFARQWRNTLLISAGYAVLISWSLSIQLRPIYSLLMTALLMVIFYALYNWRSFADREKFMAQLRPFVSSQQMFQHLLTPQNDLLKPQQALSSRARNRCLSTICHDVYGREKCLSDSARFAPLAVLLSATPIYGGLSFQPIYPKSAAVPLPSNLPESPTTAIVPLPQTTYPDLRWAIPLWAERGRIGVLLLGEKSDGGLYTQEEVEIARSSGERIIDTLAGEQMARRLMELQRGRLAESRVMDRRTRRVLHDDILPTLHTALLKLSAFSRSEPAVKEAIQSLTAAHQQIADLIHSARQAADPNSSWNLAEALQSMVQDEFQGEFTSVNWTIADSLPALDAITYEVVTGAAREVIRNAALHGRGDQPEHPLNLSIDIGCDKGISITICDDGVGFNYAANGKKGGSGNGLALHTTMLAIVGGSLVAEAAANGGTIAIINLASGWKTG